MTGISSVWSALAGGFAQYGIPYIDSDNQPAVDIENFRYDYINKRWHFGMAGYYPTAFEFSLAGTFGSHVLAVDSPTKTAGFYTYAPRDSFSTPSNNISGDRVGRFGGRGRTNGADTSFGAMDVYVGGSAASLGGYVVISCKVDGSAAERGITVSPTQGGTGSFFPSTNGELDLGSLGYGWKRIYATVSFAGTTGNITLNTSNGRVEFAPGAQTIVLTNSYITPNSNIFCTVRTDDATAKSCIAISGNGQATLKLNAAATAQTSVAFLVISSDA